MSAYCLCFEMILFFAASSMLEVWLNFTLFSQVLSRRKPSTTHLRWFVSAAANIYMYENDH